MSHRDKDREPASFSRDTGETPQYDPFAAVRQLRAFQASTATSASSASAPVAPVPVPPATGAERRPLSSGGEELAENPPAKRTKVNNTVVSCFPHLAPQLI